MSSNDTTENQHSHDHTSQRQQQDGSWQSAALMHIATASLEEQRRTRRWRVFLILAFLALIWYASVSAPRATSVGSVTLSSDTGWSEPHVAVIEVRGVIIDAPIGAELAISHDRVLEAMENTTGNSSCRGIILAINSPGGGVFESERLHESIQEFREKNPDRPVVALAQDIALSGGLYISMAADRFYAHRTSLVGSIGVLIPLGFGLDRVIGDLNIDRRLVTSGPNKAIGDPFSSFPAGHRQRLQDIVDEVHGLFVDRVESSRGDSLTGDRGEVFSGAFWTASKALEYGLIDGLGTKTEIAESEFGTSDIRDYTVRENPWEKFLRHGQQIFSPAGIVPGLQRASSVATEKYPTKTYYLAF